jgi:UDP-N-acetylglucosamine 2-epimerase (non-hydrolysing)
MMKNKLKKILIVFGTRPEAIKIVALIKEFEKNKEFFDIKICITSQHKEMLYEVLNIFDINPDYDLSIMKRNQDLFDITTNILDGIKVILEDVNPDLVVVHGDTSTAFVSSLASFYKQIDVAHIEAGLRTNNIYNPYPEELNRQFISKIAKFHFAPTTEAKINLLNEKVDEKNIMVTGNTVVDTLYHTLDTLENKELSDIYLNDNKKVILVTLHRRENIGESFKNICESLKEIAKVNPNINIVYPVHLNPKIKGIAYQVLNDISNIFLIKPLAYDKFVNLMNKSIFIITDSGGIQEEAISLGKPLIITRETTERVELLNLNGVQLVGTSKELIIKSVQEFIDLKIYNNMEKSKVYGDGKASQRIVEFLKEFYDEK